MPRAAIDLTRMTFGDWQVVRRDTAKHKHAHWLCRCRCGAECIVSGAALREGRTLSCGHASSIKHGHAGQKTRSILYRTWAKMKTRCSNKNVREYANYGGRGITVCDRWQGFVNFLNDMEPTWRSGLTLDRRENNLGYSPENCRWASLFVQANNRRTNRYYEWRGERHTLASACRITGVPYSRAQARLLIGWSFDEAVTRPKGRRVTADQSTT